GLESRVPLLDHPLIEFLATVPADVKFEGGRMKHLLKRAYADVLPSAIADRRDKMGFPVPLKEWFSGELRGLVQDTFRSRPGRRDNLKPQHRLQLIEDSIVDERVVDGLIGDFRPDVVVHTAASYKNPDDWQGDALTNCVGSANIARSCKDHKVGRLIYFQTALCYGTKPAEQPITLTHPLNPVNSSHAISKTTGEHYIQLSGVDWVTFRLANIVGPRNVSGPLPIFFDRLAQGKRCFVTEARRDFVFVRD